MRRVISTSCRTHNYAVSEKNSYPPLGRSLNFLGRRWSKKGKILEANMDINCNLIGGGGGVQNKKKTFLGMSKDIVFGTAQQGLDDSNVIT